MLVFYHSCLRLSQDISLMRGIRPETRDTHDHPQVDATPTHMVSRRNFYSLLPHLSTSLQLDGMSMLFSVSPWLLQKLCWASIVPVPRWFGQQCCAMMTEVPGSNPAFAIFTTYLSWEVLLLTVPKKGLVVYSEYSIKLVSVVLIKRLLPSTKQQSYIQINYVRYSPFVLRKDPKTRSRTHTIFKLDTILTLQEKRAVIYVY